MPTKKSKPAKTTKARTVKKRPAPKTKKTPKKGLLHHIKRLSTKGFAVKNFLIFMLAFAVIGGAYMAYRSFAYVGALGASGEFTAVTPARILDTRNGTGGYNAPLGQGATYEVQIAGMGGVPASGIQSVVMNVTVTNPTAASFLTIFPSNQANPGTSNLNFSAGQTIPNQVTVKVGANGKVKVYNQAGSVNVIFDVAGYYSDINGNPGGRFTAVTPARILDTRNGTGGYNAPLGQGATYEVQIAGKGGLPASGVQAVIMNVTVVDPTSESFMTIWPSDKSQPNTSSLNFGAGQIIPNQVTVKVGADGKVKVYNANGSAGVIFDVAGYYANASDPNSLDGRFVPLDSPTRILDTRSVGTGSVGQTAYEVEVNGQQGWPKVGSIQAVVMNTTVTGSTAGSFLTVWPSDVSRPNTSNLNFSAGQTIPNQVTVKTGKQGTINLFSAAGKTHVILDVAGYFVANNRAPANLVIVAKDFNVNNSGTKPTLVAETAEATSSYQVMQIPAQGADVTPRFVSIMADQSSEFMTKSATAGTNVRMCATLKATSGTGKATISTFATLRNGTDLSIAVPSSSYGQVCTNWSRSDGSTSTNLIVTNLGSVPLRVKDMQLQVDAGARPAIFKAAAGQNPFALLNGATLKTAADGTKYAELQPGGSQDVYLDSTDSYNAENYFWSEFRYVPGTRMRFCAEVAAPYGDARALISSPVAGGTNQYIKVYASSSYSKICGPLLTGSLLGSSLLWAYDKPLQVRSLSVEAR